MEEFIPIVAMSLVLGPIAVWAVSFSPLGRAVADRLRGRASGPDDRLFELQDEMERLQDHVAVQDQRIEDLHDRLDFAERLLAKPEGERVATPV